MLFFVNQLKLLTKYKLIHIAGRFISKNKYYKVKMFDKSFPHRSDPIIMTLNTPEFKSIFTPELITLADIFKRNNYELRLVGGAVRDILMNVNPKDLDFATNATPDQMKEMFEREDIRMINSNGERHGTVTSRINDKQNFEVTTLRVDIATNGRHADVIFTTDWLLDASRRDLTINSMFVDLDGRLYDYFYGYDDLMNRRVVFVGNPSDRICEDYLRIFRYFRFYGRVSDRPNDYDETIIKAIKDNVSGIEIVSGERIWSEWRKILDGNFSREVTLKLLECNCGQYMGLPENPNYQEFDEVYSTARRNNIKLQPISYVSALLNNEDDIFNLFMRLKCTKFERDLALFLINCRNNDIDESSIKKYQKSILKTIIKFSDAVDYVSELFRYKGASHLIEDFQKCDYKFPISGKILLSYTDDKKIIKDVLYELKDIWVDSNFELSIDELTSYISEVIEKVKTEKKQSLPNNEYNLFKKWNSTKNKIMLGKRKHTLN